MNNNFINIGLLILALVLGYLIYSWVHEPEIVYKKVELTNFEKQQLIQKGRLGWVSPDSLKSLLKDFAGIPAKLINWKDSTRWHTKDTTIYHFKDSTVASFPMYEADSTFTAEKTDSARGASAKVVMTMHQRFLPLQEVFASDFQIDTLLVKWHQKQLSKSWLDHIKFGPGVSVDIDGKFKPTLSIIYSFGD